MDIFVDLLLFVIAVVISVVSGIIINKKRKKNINSLEQGNLKYPPYIIDKTTFIEECKMGLVYSTIRINSKIYEIETTPGDNKSIYDYDSFICYINKNEIIGIDNFLNYKLEDNNTLNDLENIEFLECNEDDPKKYFVDRIL